MSSMVYSFHWISVSRSREPAQNAQPTDGVPEPPPTQSTETENAQNSEQSSSNEPPEE